LRLLFLTMVRKLLRFSAVCLKIGKVICECAHCDMTASIKRTAASEAPYFSLLEDSRLGFTGVEAFKLRSPDAKLTKTRKNRQLYISK